MSVLNPQLSTPSGFGRGLRVRDEMAAWLTPEISLMRPRAEDPVNLYLTVGPQKL